MEIIAHSLWAAAAATTANRKTRAHISLGWTAWWAMFPDVLAFGPGIVGGLALRVAGTPVTESHHLLPRVHIGLPLYAAAHSLIGFTVVFAITCILVRRVILPMLRWLLHILIDIPTHSFSYHPTQFLWPVSDLGLDGIAWWTRWFWVATYVALVAVYFVMWRKGWVGRPRRRTTRTTVPDVHTLM